MIRSLAGLTFAAFDLAFVEAELRRVRGLADLGLMPDNIHGSHSGSSSRLKPQRLIGPVAAIAGQALSAQTE